MASQGGVQDSTEESALKRQLKAIMCDPEVLGMISRAVAAQVTTTFRKEMAELKQQLAERDRQLADRDTQILKLQDQVDSLEQYGRRNCVRISSIPEVSNENRDELVRKVAESIGVSVGDGDIDRSHRVGRKQDGSCRSVLVKFTSYKPKLALVKARKGLARVDARKTFPDLAWPPLSAPPAGRRVFINDDLTAVRAEIAAKARQLKRAEKITDTWVRDGVIFIKKGDSVYKISTLRQLLVFRE